MPTMAFASFYWPGDGLVNAVPQATISGYPIWQAAVTACLLLLVVL